MIDETLRKLEERIRAAGRGDVAQKELLDLVAQLRDEFTATSETHSEDAAAIAKHAHAAAEPPHIPVEQLEDSMREFQAAHPKLTGALRSLLQTLADAGI